MLMSPQPVPSGAALSAARAQDLESTASVVVALVEDDVDQILDHRLVLLPQHRTVVHLQQVRRAVLVEHDVQPQQVERLALLERGLVQRVGHDAARLVADLAVQRRVLGELLVEDVAPVLASLVHDLIVQRPGPPRHRPLGHDARPVQVGPAAGPVDAIQDVRADVELAPVQQQRAVDVPLQHVGLAVLDLRQQLLRLARDRDAGPELPVVLLEEPDGAVGAQVRRDAAMVDQVRPGTVRRVRRGQRQPIRKASQFRDRVLDDGLGRATADEVDRRTTLGFVEVPVELVAVEPEDQRDVAPHGRIQVLEVVAVEVVAVDVDAVGPLLRRGLRCTGYSDMASLLDSLYSYPVVLAIVGTVMVVQCSVGICKINIMHYS